MKRKLTLVIICCMFVLSLCGLVACNTGVHTHELEKVEATAATCTEAGNKEYYRCKSCDKIFADENYTEISAEETIISALGHDLEHHDEKSATCTEDGWKAYDTCKHEGCEYTTYEKILATHTPSEAVKENEVAASCETEGSYDLVVYCSVCEKELSRETKTVETLGHTHADAVKENEVAATCEKEGSYDLVVYCSVCEKEISRESKTIAALGHVNTERHEKVEATCTTAGTIEYWSCPDCNKNFSDEACENEVTDLTITALGHDEISHEAKAATCTEAGWEEYVTCSRCEHSTYQEIAALGHDYEYTFTAPTKLTYARGEKLDLSGMSLILKCANCQDEKDVTSLVVLDKTVAPSVDDDKVTITATYEKISETFDITLNKRDEVFSCYVGWGTPSDGAHTESFFVEYGKQDGVTGFSGQKEQCVSFQVGGKMRFYFYSDSIRLARLSCRAATNPSMHASAAFNVNIYKPVSEGQALTELVSEKLTLDSNATIAGNWTDFSAEIYLGTIRLQKGWNVVEVEVTKTNGRDFNFKSMMLDYITSDSTVINVTDEVFSCWMGWGTPTDGAHTASFFVENGKQDGVTGFSANDTMCSSFQVGGKIRFYFYSDEARTADLSCRVATGNGTCKINDSFVVNLYKPTSEGQSLSELTAEKLTILDSVTYGYSLSGNDWLIPWTDFDNPVYLGKIQLQKGWNVVEVEVTKTNAWDFNFRSMIVEYEK